MSVYMTADRLARLRALRDQVDAEIRQAERILLGRQHKPDRVVTQPAPRVTTAQIRAWLRERGIAVGTNGRISDTYRQLYADAHRDPS